MRILVLEWLRRRLGWGLPALRPRADRALRRFLPRSVRGEVAPGIRVSLDMDDLSQRHTWWQGVRYEEPTVPLLRSWCQEGRERFFDIGANYGFYSFCIASACPDVEVHAFEPNPVSVRVLERALRENRLEHVHLAPIALGDHEAVRPLHLGDIDSGHTTLGPHPDLAESEQLATVMPFDRWRIDEGIALPDRPRWVAKIDVEGYEQRVLQGMSEALAAKAFLGLALELNEYTLTFCGTSKREVEDNLRAHGYRRLEETEAGHEWRVQNSWNAFFVPDQGR